MRIFGLTNPNRYANIRHDMTIPVLIKLLNKAGKQACLNHPKAKLWAKVNHDDNFTLAMKSTVEDAMMDVICNRIDLNDKACIDWWNKECNGEFKRMTPAIAKECYQLLRA